MAREWTDQHILELIKQLKVADGKATIKNDLRTTAGLEYKLNLDYNGLASRDKSVPEESNLRRVNISIPELSPALKFDFAEMFPGKPTFEAPVELSIILNSPYQPFNKNGFIGYISKARPVRFQVAGGWLDASTPDSIQLDPDLVYPDISIDILTFQNMTDDAGHLLHIYETTLPVYPDYPGFRDTPITIPVYRIEIDGLTEWPANGFHFHKVITLGGS